MSWAIAIGVACLLISGLVHYLAMHFLNVGLSVKPMSRALRSQVALLGLAVAHLVEAGVYAFGFSLGVHLELGAFVQETQIDAMTTFYFSLVNYTSLGLGDIHPTSHLRFLAGLESLNGFLLISCSAAYLFLVANDKSKKEATDVA